MRTPPTAQAGESLTVHKRPVEFECWGDLARLYAMRRVRPRARHPDPP